MPNLRYYPVPAALQRYIERPLMIDFSGAIGFKWQFFPTGCYGLSLLVGPQDQDFELDTPDDDGAIAGVVPHVMGTWCDRACFAFGVSLTPCAAVHLPLVAHDFQASIGAPREVLVGRAAQADLRRRVRAARSVDDKMHAFLRWLESFLLDRRPAHGRAVAIAEAAHAMRLPRPPGLQEAARRVGLQRRQFERDFQHYLGMAPKRYSTIARVQQVGQLAWQGVGLAGIAAELGFVDQAHMTRIVKEVAGMTPAALLQRAATSELARATRPFTGGRITHLELDAADRGGR
jgi:AraC-like DNA-binding protein